MNYDTVKFCWTCQKPKPREEFAPVRPGSRRVACASCRGFANQAVIRERKA